MLIKIFLAALVFSLLLAFSISPASGENNPKVIIKTTQGDIVLELFLDKAPLTVENFLSYVDDKFYDGTIFHRVIKEFMIQGGGHLPDMSQKPTKGSVRNEAGNGLSNKRGTVAMARMPDPHSATAQFFINHADNTSLDHQDNTNQGYGYCVFGKVIEGMDIVDLIANTKTMTKSGYRDVPREAVVITSIRRTE